MFIKVCDNVISEKYSQYLFEEVVQLPWSFVPNLSYGNTENYDAAGFSFTYFLDKKFNAKEPKDIKSAEYKYIVPLILQSFDVFGLDVNISSVFRSRVRFTLNRTESVIEDRHVDYNFPHLVLLYYFNSTDGDTVLFKDDKIVERITPKRGRCVLFDGQIQHASSSSTLAPRLVLNNNIMLA